MYHFKAYLVGSTITIKSNTQLIFAQIFAGQSHTSTQWNLAFYSHSVNLSHIIIMLILREK